MSESVLIVGAGQGLSESLARLCVSKNIKVVLAARNIAKTYLQFYHQDKSAWSWEVELRTSVEKF